MISYRVVLSTFLLFTLIVETKCISITQQMEMLIKGYLGFWLQLIAIGWSVLTILWLIGFLVLWMAWQRLQVSTTVLYSIKHIDDDKIQLFDPKETMNIKKPEDEFASEKKFKKKMKTLPKKEPKNSTNQYWRMIIQAIREEKNNKDKKEKMIALRRLFRTQVHNQLVRCYTVKDEDKEK
ncbi:hypothetical protein PRIPAC_72486 [Pristionchus pacificus]|uniref:Uncharacterized protein n=1 Tax=Pristionchus pacificus TaxID=54126 RepID=A0A2A6D0L4_PRIPA|nr:hypothetical protein PRIPAC_72486 [Pristionchus pacificus]|eukprot:PDM83831.1 hypothetical protein PRIPAC_30318 [Pristionchus pacificus]